MVDFFLEHGTEISLRQAASWGKIDRGRSFLDRNPAQANNETEPMLPIHEATLFGHLDIVSLLGERGADLNRRDQLGRTALNIALLRLLPIHGDSYNLVDEDVLVQIANGQVILSLIVLMKVFAKPVGKANGDGSDGLTNFSSGQGRSTAARVLEMTRANRSSCAPAHKAVLPRRE